ncbi:hypothetical protein ACIJDO_002589 [Enterococcus hirae]
MDFNRSYPKLASFLKDHFAISRKSQQQSLWHWFTLILFGTFILATFTQQLLLLFSLILLVALIKGPGMILWGAIYAFLISLFPPLGIILSALFFLLNLSTFTKNWRVTLVAGFFYFYPAMIMSLRTLSQLDNPWFLYSSLFAGLVLLHLMLQKLYQRYGIGRTIFWYIVSIPFTLLSFLLPTRLKERFKKIPSKK